MSDEQSKMIEAAELDRVQAEAMATEVIEADDYIPSDVQLSDDEIPF